ncbi:SDR family oxidoreductase [Agromyces archimandritae]|uniref:SDR family oxidoreductase n=1 Tax=Agromyces archimandritae TaxID=2781962 RepID=UPI003CC7EF4A
MDRPSEGSGIRCTQPRVSNRTSLLQRFIEPAEIARLVGFLASPLSSATNGAALRADGGTLTGIL